MPAVHLVEQAVAVSFLYPLESTQKVVAELAISDAHAHHFVAVESAHVLAASLQVHQVAETVPPSFVMAAFIGEPPVAEPQKAL